MNPEHAPDPAWQWSGPFWRVHLQNWGVLNIYNEDRFITTVQDYITLFYFHFFSKHSPRTIVILYLSEMYEKVCFIFVWIFKKSYLSTNMRSLFYKRFHPLQNRKPFYVHRHLTDRYLLCVLNRDASLSTPFDGIKQKSRQVPTSKCNFRIHTTHINCRALYVRVRKTFYAKLWDSLNEPFANENV